MTVRKIPMHLRGLEYVEQVSWAAGDPGAGYTSVRAWDVKFTPTIEMVPMPTQKPESCRGPDAAIPAGEGGTLTFKTYLRGGAGSTSEFMNLAVGTGTVTKRAAALTKVKSATASTLVALTADIGTYTVGDAIMVGSGTTDTQIRFISRVQDDVPIAGDTTLNVEPNWSDTPGASDNVYAMDTMVPADGEPSAYLTFLAYSGQGATDRHEWKLEGCAGTWKLAGTDANACPVVEWSFQVDEWTSSEDSTTLDADSFEPAHPLLNDPFYVNDTATKVSSIGFDPAHDLQPYTATSGANGRAGWLYTGDTDPQLEIMPYWDTDWVTMWGAATEFQATLESIKDTDEAWGMHCPAVQVMSLEEDDAGNKHTGTKMSFQLVDPGKNTDDTNLPRWAIGVSGGGP